MPKVPSLTDSHTQDREAAMNAILEAYTEKLVDRTQHHLVSLPDPAWEGQLAWCCCFLHHGLCSCSVGCDPLPGLGPVDGRLVLEPCFIAPPQGYPYNLDFDYGALEKLVKFSINNLGDPFIESNYGVHSREFEVGVLNWWVADHGAGHGVDRDRIWEDRGVRCSPATVGTSLAYDRAAALARMVPCL